MKKIVVLLLILAALPLVMWHATAQGQPGYQVITHKDNPVTSIPKKDLSKMLLKRISRWEDGTQVVPVDQGAKEAVRIAFTKDVHGRSVSGVKNYWQSIIFSGKGVPPQEVASDSEVINFVKARPGSIGYVSSGAALAGVKVLTVAE